MAKNEPYGVSIHGHVFKFDDTSLGHHEFLEAFIEFVESKGWGFGGVTKQCDNDGEPAEDCDDKLWLQNKQI